MINDTEHNPYLKGRANADLDTLKARSYDKIFVGGGIASLFAAYVTLREAKAAGRDMDIIVLAKELNAPCSDGSHLSFEIEGMIENPDYPDKPLIDRILRDAMADLSETVKREAIDCQMAMGQEIKARSAQELNQFIAESVEAGVFAADEATINSGKETFHLPYYQHSISVNSICQLNAPLLLGGIIKVIERLGSAVVAGITYESHETDPDGNVVVKTSAGNFNTKTNPFLGTGPEHQSSLDDFHFDTEFSYPSCMVIGPLNEEDAAIVSEGGKPIAFTDTDLVGDPLWGTLSPGRTLTIGKRSFPAPDYVQQKADLLDLAKEFFPVLTEKYPCKPSFGTVLVSENMMPIVGRMARYDIAGAWLRNGIVPAMAAAKAFAKYYVHGDDEDLRIFEAMQPRGFTGASS